MELKLNQQKENKLLQRIEVVGNISFTGATPSNDNVAEALSKQLKAPKDCIRLQSILGKFGETTATVNAHVYKTKEQLDKIEPKIKVKAQEE